MTYKVVQWGTGNRGTLAVQSILKHPDLELIGTKVSSAQKEGCDVSGAVPAVPPIGVLATQDADALISGGLLIAQLRRRQTARGCEDDVESTISIKMLQVRQERRQRVRSGAGLPQGEKGGDRLSHRLQEVCLGGQQPGRSCSSGADPGWAGFGLALAPLTVAQQVRSIRLFEIYNYGPWDNPQPGLYGFPGESPIRPPR